MDNAFKRRDLFALLPDLFAAALVGEAAGGGSWRLSLIGGTRLITFYRASLSLAKPLGSLIALQQIHIHHGLIAQETSLIRVSGALLQRSGAHLPIFLSFFHF